MDLYRTRIWLSLWGHTFRKHFGMMAGTTGLEPATSAVTAKRKVVTYKKQTPRMAPFWRCKERSVTIIEPISNPRPLSRRPLPLDKRLRALSPFFHSLPRSHTSAEHCTRTMNGGNKTCSLLQLIAPNRSGFGTKYHRDCRSAWIPNLGNRITFQKWSRCSVSCHLICLSWFAPNPVPPTQYRYRLLCAIFWESWHRRSGKVLTTY